AEGRTWLTSGPASLLAEPIPTGVLSSSAKLHRPPAAIVPAAILPEALPAAWKGNTTTALAIATALSQQAGQTLPWKSVRDVINSAIFARFIRTAEDSAPWPCEIPAANNVKLQLPEPSGKSGRDKEDDDDTLRPEPTLARKASAILEASHFQDLSDALPKVLAIKDSGNAPLAIRVELIFGDKTLAPTHDQIADANAILERVHPDLKFE
ncbi:MAG: hypothetical protein ACKOGA_15215, partial [Planctomycetaceae bacterium]